MVHIIVRKKGSIGLVRPIVTPDVVYLSKLTCDYTLGMNLRGTYGLTNNRMMMVLTI